MVTICFFVFLYSTEFILFLTIAVALVIWEGMESIKRERLPSSEAAPDRQVWKCLVTGCVRHAEGRGLCRSCLSLASKLVKEKKVTWEELEKRSKCLPKGEQRRTRAKWFLGEATDEELRPVPPGPPVMEEKE